MTLTIDRLRDELAEARETNRRLNRRVQEQDRRIAQDWHILDSAAPKPTAEDTVSGSKWSFSRAYLRVFKDRADLRTRLEAAEAEVARLAMFALETERRSTETAGADEGWQPIETAPKDGTHILAYCDRMKEVGEVMWSTSFGRWGATWVIAGFNQPWASRPTHWRPLPAPPQPAVQGRTK